MKRTFVAVTLAVFLAAPAFSQQVSFKFSGGWTKVQGDDYKAAAAGLMSLLRDTSSSVTGEYRPLTDGPVFQAEIMTHWGKRLAVGIGGGYYQFKNDELVTNATIDATTETKLKPSILGIPFFLNIHYKMALGPKAGLEAYGGPVFQITQFSSERTAASTADPLSEVESYKASVPKLGLQAGISLSLSLGNGISLVADGLYRHVKADDFVGNWTYFSSASTGTTSGTSTTHCLWSYDSTGAKPYALVGFYDENGPTGAGISNARKAVLNLSGVTFTAGIKIDL